MARRLAVVTAILLIGAALRLRGLGLMLNMAHYDEAYYGVDALSLITQPRFTPFFPDNFGRESLWMYLLAPSLAVFGGGAFGLRIVAVFTGVLTLAAVYRLARALLGWRGAVWALAALAALFWHVLASHEAFRALLFPLVGALAFAFLWNARRTNRLHAWVVGGILLGLMGYTYLAARAWLALAGFTLIWWFARARPHGQRRGVVVAALVAGAISLPLLIYLLTHPAAADQRLAQVAVSDFDALLNNIGVWLRVPFSEGSPDVVYNLPGLPLLDLPLALLFAAGIAALVFVLRRDRALWLIALIGASIAPALLTTEPLRWLRAIGLVVPLAIVMGAGGDIIERIINLTPCDLRSPSPLHKMERGSRAKRTERSPRFSEQVREGSHRDGGEVKHRSRALGIATIIPALLLLVAGGDTLRDFDRWVSSPDLFLPMEQHIYQGIDWVADNTPADAPVYFSPFSLDHPVLRLREWRLEARPVGAFLPAQCLVLSRRAAYYLTIPSFTPGFVEQLGSYASVEAVQSADPRYAIYRADPRADLPDDWTIIGERIAAENISPLPDAASNGDTLELTMAFRRVGAVDRPYTMFAHLYGVDEKVGIMLIGQDDQPICLDYPPSLWREEETIIQRFAIPVDTTVHGEFAVGIGIYDSITQERLMVGAETSVQPIHRLRIN